MRVLLVEEDRLVARSLDRLLAFAGPDDIELSTATTLDEALLLLANLRFEVVVSDMRDSTGQTVMEIARRQSPQALRLALSGHAEAEEVAPLLSPAHRHLAKPLRYVELERIFDRLKWLRTLLPPGQTRTLLHHLKELPPMPATYAKLTQALASYQAGANELAAIIEQDPALAAKLLQLVSSSYFASNGCIGDIGRAVVLIGGRAIKAMALAVEILELPGLSSRLRRRWQRHALLVANVSAQLARSPRDAEHAFAAGLLHNVGEIVLAMNRPEHLETVLDRARVERKPSIVVERDLEEVPHPLLGAYLLGLWGLPRALAEAVLEHHEALTDAGSLSGVLQLANALVGELGGDSLCDHVTPLDDETVEALEIEDELGDWRIMVAAEAQRVARLLA